MKLENSTRRCVTTARAGDNAAGEAGAGIPGRVALVVVHAFVNHDRGAGRVKERIRLAWLQRDGRIQYFDRELAVLRDMEVRHVAGMTVAPQHAGLFLGGIEVRACRVEGRRMALTDGMDMERMLARRHSFERKGLRLEFARDRRYRPPCRSCREARPWQIGPRPAKPRRSSAAPLRRPFAH